MLKVVESENQPVHLVLGRNELAAVRRNQAEMSKEWDRWEELAESTSFTSDSSN